jgi:hypothetical protein
MTPVKCIAGYDDLAPSVNVCANVQYDWNLSGFGYEVACGNQGYRKQDNENVLFHGFTFLCDLSRSHAIDAKVINKVSVAINSTLPV